MAEKFFEMYLPMSGTFVENSFQRKDEFPIPKSAFREAMINALCHRDYSDRAGSISVAIYDDHLEISNTGELSDKLSLKDLEKKHNSYPRNKIIAEVFHKCHLIEKWGTGTTKIIELCKQAGLPKPIYTEYSGGFSVVFKFRGSLRGNIVGEETNISDEQLKITPRQREIVAILAQASRASINEILEKLNIKCDRRTILRDLKNLHAHGIVFPSGSKRGARWELNKEKP